MYIRIPIFKYLKTSKSRVLLRLEQDANMQGNHFLWVRSLSDLNSTIGVFNSFVGKAISETQNGNK